MADYFEVASVPATGAALSSAVIRAEFASIATGFTKVAAYTGNGGKILAINAGGTAQEAVTTTGTGSAVRATSPTLVTPLLGTPTSGNLANCTGFPVASVANLGTGVATFLATPSSANLLAAITDETGSGALVFGTAPTISSATLVGPALGTPSSGVLTNCTGTASGLTAGNVTTNANLTGPITSVGNATAVASQTGTGSTFVMQASPTLTTPNLGTPSACVATNLTGTAASLTAGAATILATARAIYGNDFDGSAALTQIIASTYGGTGNGFTKFSGPTTTEKTFTLPDASGTVAVLNQVQAYSKAQSGTPVALTSSGASIAVDLSQGNNFTHTCTENTTLASPSNPVAGQSGAIVITQHASAPKTLAYNSFWKFAGGTVPTLTATNSAVDVFTYYVESASRATCSLVADVK